MKGKQRKQYPAEYKREAVRLVTEQGYKISEAARNLGIHGGMLGRWVRRGKESGNGVVSGKGPLSPEQVEIQRLRSENKRLLMEREILKKAAAFFAKESS